MKWPKKNQKRLLCSISQNNTIGGRKPALKGIKMKKSHMIKLLEAIKEAERFIDRAESAKNEIYEYQQKIDYWTKEKKTGAPMTSKKYAAAKRASLDLSAVLVELRK